MDAQVESLFAEAMKLSPDDRESLAGRLYSSLHGDLPLDPAWDGEIARRVREIESGELEGVPADEVHRKMRERLGE